VRRRLSPVERAALDRESLRRAREGTSVANDVLCVQAFAERGIPVGEIEPRVNVLTFNAWRAVGRFVRKGEKAVKLPVIIPVAGEAAEGEEPEIHKRRGWAYVFHVSQTETRVVDRSLLD